MTIRLTDVWQFPEGLSNYKVHFARWNKFDQPLEILLRSQDEWRAWQEWRPRRDEFNRAFIFTLAQFYHETDVWLFGGVYRVVARHADRYEVALTDQGAGFIRRLKIFSPYRSRATRVNLERNLPKFEVQEVLREPYSGRAFPGYEEIDLSFEELEALVRNNRPDWKAALESVKGVYLISDELTGKRYVGSAIGDSGIWSRWCTYAFSGHGGNVELRTLATDPSLDYCRRAFRFSLLEHRSRLISDETVLVRESFWKRVLLTRGAQGLNRN